jgi:glycosyltransferase involved in cell wall biosynthesis
MNKIKLLYTLSSLHGGGAERVGLTILDNIDPIKFDCVLFLHKKEGNYLNQIPSNLKVNYLLPDTKIIILKNILSIIALPFLLLKTIFLSRKFDVLIAGIESTYITYATIISGILNNIPVIVIVHNDISENTALKKTFHYRIIKWLYKYCTYCICVSKGVQNGIINEIPTLSNKSSVIYNPFVIDDIITKGEMLIDKVFDNPFIISSGRLQKVKRFDLLILAHQKVLKYGIPHSLVIIGEGECKNELMNLADELGVSTTVFFLGFDFNPHRWVSKAYCFVLTSENEGFGNVLVESMAVGTPVISTNCPSGPSEILDNGKYGILVSNQNLDEIAEAIKTMFLDHTLYNFFKTITVDRSRKFSIQNSIEIWESLIRNIIIDFKKKIIT